MTKHQDLRALRESRNLTLAKTAKKLGVSKGYISHLETGIRKLNDDMMTRIAKVLDYPENIVWKAAQRSGLNNTIESSWISNVRINGYPVFDAFKYHLKAKKKRLDVKSKARIRNQLVKFINENLPFSVLAELSENEVLLDRVIEHCKK